MNQQTYIALLRGINVSGQKPVKMTELKALFESLGFHSVETYIQSGNVVFKSGDINDIVLAVAKIESAIEKKYDFVVPVILRNAEDLKNIIAGNSYANSGTCDLKYLHVTFLNSQPEKDNIEYALKGDYSPNTFYITGREIYLHCPGGYGKTKLNNNFFESKLKVKATTRNWNTVNVLYEMAKK
jgi:uncharacterized protein (DUF1697 family)